MSRTKTFLDTVHTITSDDGCTSMSSKHIIGIGQLEPGKVSIVHGNTLECDHAVAILSNCPECLRPCADCGEVGSCAPSCHQVTDSYPEHLNEAYKRSRQRKRRL